MLYNFILICENALIDKSNKASLINIIEEIKPIGLPIIIPRLVIFIKAEKESTDGDNLKYSLRITLNESELFNGANVVEFLGKDKVRIITELSGFPISHAGLLKFDVLDSDSKVQLSTSIKITLPAQPQVVADSTK